MNGNEPFCGLFARWRKEIMVMLLNFSFILKFLQHLFSPALNVCINPDFPISDNTWSLLDFTYYFITS